MAGVPAVESVDDGGVGNCVITATVTELLLWLLFWVLLFNPLILLLLLLYDDIDDRLCGQCGRANCSILNGLFLGGTFDDPEDDVDDDDDDDVTNDENDDVDVVDEADDKLLPMPDDDENDDAVVNGEFGVNNDDIRDPIGDGNDDDVTVATEFGYIWCVWADDG